MNTLVEDAQIKSSTHRAVAEMRALIFRGELAAGSNHLESELADRLGMSRTPVREAAVVLEAQGLVQLVPRKGLRILPVSLKDMDEIYDILTELESLAAQNAAARGLVEHELADLADAISQMETALEREDRDAWAEADDRFHSELVKLGGNSRLQSIVGMMSDQVRRARAITLHMRPLPVKSNKDHRGVFEAIRNGEPERARRLHTRHRAEAKKLLMALLRKHRLFQL